MRINGTGSPEAGTIKTQLDSALTSANSIPVKSCQFEYFFAFWPH
jgi:hypothetical protein